MIRVADYIIDFLTQKGVEHIFLLPGGGAMFLNDGVVKSKAIKYTAVHHEQTATMAAEAYARANHKLGVAMVTCGPGATNAITGVLGAWMDSTPLLVLSGQCKTGQTIISRELEGLRQLGAQEANIIPMVKPITKLAIQVREANKMKYYLEKAYQVAVEGRSGPVWLDIPLDVQGALIDEDTLQGYEIKKEGIQLDSVQVAKTYELLQKAKRPVIIAGNGMRKATHKEILKKLIEQFDIPVVTTRLGCDVIDEDNPYFIGRVGIRGNRSGNFAVQNADLILALGTRLSVPVTGYEYEYFAREAKVIMVDLDQNELNKATITVDYPIQCDVGVFIRACMQLAKNVVLKHEKWLEKCTHWKMQYPACMKQYKQQNKGVNSYYLVDVLSSEMKEEEIMISDAGSAIDVVYHAFKVKLRQKVILSGGLASMGYAVPAAIGASINQRENTVVVTGDGSLQMNIQELATLRKLENKVKIFVLNNRGYLTIRGTQNNHFNGRLIGESDRSGLGFPRLEKICEAYEIQYYKISNHQELVGKVKEILALNQVVLCEVMMDENQLIAPKQSAVALENGEMKSKPLEDMYPFLEREVFMQEMIVEPVD